MHPRMCLFSALEEVVQRLRNITVPIYPIHPHSVLIVSLVVFISILFFAFSTTLYYWWISSRCASRYLSFDLRGKVYVVTGANSGIGARVVKELYDRGATVFAVVRRPDAMIEIRRRFRSENLGSYGSVVIVAGDLSCNRSVRSAAAAIRGATNAIDGLVCNAGMGAARSRVVTADGIEHVIQVNFFGHALLTHLLLVRLRAANGVVVNVSSFIASMARMPDLVNISYADGDYSGLQAYCRSKWLLAAHSRQQARSQRGRVSIFAVNPGIVYTKIADYFIAFALPKWLMPPLLPLCHAGEWLISRSVYQAALTIWPLLVDPSVRPESGSYLDNHRVTEIIELSEVHRRRLGFTVGQMLHRFSHRRAPNVDAELTDGDLERDSLEMTEEEEEVAKKTKEIVTMSSLEGIAKAAEEEAEKKPTDKKKRTIFRSIRGFIRSHSLRRAASVSGGKETSTAEETKKKK